jgi:hypothetical protein
MGAVMKTDNLDSVKKNAVAESFKEKFTAAGSINKILPRLHKGISRGRIQF